MRLHCVLFLASIIVYSETRLHHAVQSDPHRLLVRRPMEAIQPGQRLVFRHKVKSAFMEPVEELPEILTVENPTEEDIEAFESEVAGAKTGDPNAIKVGTQASELVHPILPEDDSRVLPRNNNEALLPWLNFNDFMGDKPSRKIARHVQESVFRPNWNAEERRNEYAPVRPQVGYEMERIVPEIDKNGQKLFISQFGDKKGETFTAQYHQGKLEVVPISGIDNRVYVPVINNQGRKLFLDTSPAEWRQFFNEDLPIGPGVSQLPPPQSPPKGQPQSPPKGQPQSPPQNPWISQQQPSIINPFPAPWVSYPPTPEPNSYPPPGTYQRIKPVPQNEDIVYVLRAIPEYSGQKVGYISERGKSPILYYGKPEIKRIVHRRIAGLPFSQNVKPSTPISG